MKICPKPGCGRQLGDDVMVCPCGTLIEEGPVPTEPRSPTEPAVNSSRNNRPLPVPQPRQEWNPQSINETMSVQQMRYSMRGNPFKCGVVLVRTEVECALPMTDVNNVDQIGNPTPDGFTNIVGGLRMAGRMLADANIGERYVLLGTDGQANCGAGWFGDPQQASFDAAKELWEQRVKVGAIGIKGGTSNYDVDFLKRIVSSPQLFAEAGAGFMVQTFARMTRTATQGTSQNRSRGLVLVMDASGSMAEGTKWQEAMAVIAMIIKELRAL